MSISPSVATLTAGTVLSLCCTSASYAQNSCSYTSPANTQALLELFTSDGCDSCPPANARAAAWLKSKSAIPVSYHVTYWNYLGWPDPFSQSAFDARQNAYARSARNTRVYTPAFFLNGREWATWHRDSQALRQEVTQTAPLRLQVDLVAAADRSVDVRVRIDPIPGQTAPDPDNTQLGLLLVQDGVISRPAAGELKGVELRHEHVVRSSQILQSRQAWQRSHVHRFALPGYEAATPARWAVVAYAQSSNLRDVYQSLDAPLCF
jgi:hypothetical protein